MCIRDRRQMCIRDRTPSFLAFVGTLGMCAKECAERTPLELRGPELEAVSGPRSSSSECLER
eukprot:1749400-Alexandrium_andersonii.AAC.1